MKTKTKNGLVLAFFAFASQLAVYLVSYHVAGHELTVGYWLSMVAFMGYFLGSKS